MCFATSIVEAHKKLFIAPPAAAAAVSATASASIGEASSHSKRNTDDKTQSVAGGSGGVSGVKTKMSRNKSRLQTEVCGDCGATDPTWASINRGILLCVDCCSIHRSLGRHISIVKSLRQGHWEPSVSNFVHSLNAHGANSVWEHHLLDSQTPKHSSRVRKPTPKDSLNVKSDFIKAKHVNLAYVLKPNLLDDDDSIVDGNNLEQELSKQLHASVRTSNLETSLRLLVQGADPNFFHDEKRSTPLHVAAKFGQASQIELLLIYGADINAIDGNGLTALEVAKTNNHNTIAERLLDVMFEVTDRLIMFLGGKKPDHITGPHLPISDKNNVEISEQLKIARGRLQLVPNKMFEELVSDLYDEVDRRECEAIWALSNTANVDNMAAVPFLPANPFLSATRNQGRQKLALFSRNEFAGLLTDMLIDARRRQNMANLTYYYPSSPSAAGAGGTAAMRYNNTLNIELDPNNLSDDEPIYDPVASDCDDYAPVPPPPIAQQAIMHHSAMLSRMPEADREVNALRKQLSKYEYEISHLKTVVQQLSSENTELKSKFHTSGASGSGSVYDEPLRIDLNDSDQHNNEPLSLPEVLTLAAGTQAASSSATTTSASTSSSSSVTNSNQSTIKRPASMYERRMGSALSKTPQDARATTSMYQMPNAIDKQQQQQAQSPTSPTALDDVKQRTDLVTRRLKELIMIMQDDGSNKDALVPCAERIRLAVMELMALFAATVPCTDAMHDMVKQLNHYNIRIQHECDNLHKAYENDDKAAIELYTKDVRDCAYHIARSIKALIS